MTMINYVIILVGFVVILTSYYKCIHFCAL